MFRKYLFIPDLPSLLYFIIAVLCLLFPALYNGYPLVTSDSGAYINTGWIIEVPRDRPIGYSIFIRLASLNGVSLWGVVIAQAVILVFFLQLLVKHLLKEKYHPCLFLATAIITGGATSAGWFCGQIMPDIFTAILLLAICVLFYIPIQHRVWQWTLYVFIFSCILLHNSNLLTSMVLGVVIWFYARLRKNEMLRAPAIALLIISATGWILLSSMTAIAGRNFWPSAATHVFIMSRMVENGIAETYLNDFCGKENYKLCEWRGKLGDRQWNFMWDDAGAFSQTGGWTDSDLEYNRIILGTITKPKYLWMHIWKNSLATIRQLPLLYVGDGLQPFNDPSNPYWKVAQYFEDELKEYKSSLQQTNNLRLTGFNVVIFLFALLIITATLIVKGSKNTIGVPNELFSKLFKLTLVFLLVNAAITATFSTVVGRFQSRVVWVLIFLCLVFLLNIWLKKRKNYTA